MESGSCWCLADNISQKSLLGLNIPNFTGCHSCHSTLPLAPFYLKIAECTIPTRIIISIFLHRAVNLRLPFGRKSRGHARPSMEDMYMMHACMHASTRLNISDTSRHKRICPTSRRTTKGASKPTRSSSYRENMILPAAPFAFGLGKIEKETSGLPGTHREGTFLSKLGVLMLSL